MWAEEGIVSLNQYHISYMVIHITTWKLDLEVFSTREINPERFIESVLDSSWSQHISNMPRPGTWADHIIVSKDMFTSIRELFVSKWTLFVPKRELFSS